MLSSLPLALLGFMNSLFQSEKPLPKDDFPAERFAELPGEIQNLVYTHWFPDLQDCGLTADAAPEEVLVCAVKLENPLYMDYALRILEADVNGEWNGETALQCAIDASNVPMTRRLMSVGAVLNPNGDEQQIQPILLKRAIETGNTKVLSFLFRHKAISVQVKEDCLREAIDDAAFVKVELLLATTDFEQDTIDQFTKDWRVKRKARVYKLLKAYKSTNGLKNQLSVDLARKIPECIGLATIDKDIWLKMYHECALPDRAVKEDYLLCAIKHERVKWVSELIRAGADKNGIVLDYVNPCQHSMLMHACLQSSAEVVQVLVDIDARPYSREGAHSLLRRLIEKRQYDIVEVFCNTMDESEDTFAALSDALIRVVENGSYRTTKFLLSKLLRIGRFKPQYIAWMIEESWWHPDEVSCRLMYRSLQHLIPSRDRLRLVNNAMTRNHYDFLQHLITEGYDLNTPAQTDWDVNLSPLMYAICRQDSKAVNLLINGKASLKHKWCTAPYIANNFNAAPFELKMLFVDAGVVNHDRYAGFTDI